MYYIEIFEGKNGGSEIIVTDSAGKEIVGLITGTTAYLREPGIFGPKKPKPAGKDVGKVTLKNKRLIRKYALDDESGCNLRIALPTLESPNSDKL